MKTDISRLPFREARHFVGVHLQQGRVQLDSDWNEQSELWLRLLQRQASDVAGTGSPNEGFRVDDRIVLDTMDVRAAWRAEPPAAGTAELFVDVFDHRVGTGSLFVRGADAVARRLEAPLDWRDLAEVRVAAKGSFGAAACEFFVGSGGARVTIPTAEVASPLPGGWRLFRAAPAGVMPALAAVDEYGLRALDANQEYRFDVITVDLPIREVLVPTARTDGFTVTGGAGAAVRVTDDFLLWRSTAIEVQGATGLRYDLPARRDLTRVRRLLHAARSDAAGTPVFQLDVVDATGAATEVTLAGTVVGTVDGWTVRSYPIPSPSPADFSRIAAFKWVGLAAGTIYRFAPVLAERALDGDLVIMGGDGTPEGAGRFHGDGLAAVKEAHETYLSQRDLPEADASALAPAANGNCRTDLAYLDLWERPVTYLEEPDVREIALEGPDTCTRTQLVAQVRLLKGAEVAVGTTPQPPTVAFAALPRIGRGTLTTKDQPAALLDPCADPCEPRVRGTFVGDENRLFRVEVHAAGGIGPAGVAGTALFKWSRENAAVATPLLAPAVAGAFSARVERPDLFAIDDLVEVADDLADLVTGPYGDRRQTRGELRRIRTIDLNTRIVSWSRPGSTDPLHAALPRDYRLPHHPKIRRWDAVLPVTPGDIVLDDGVVIAFGGVDLIPGDFWTFASRLVDRSVERLVEAPPQGVRHRYFPLALVHRCTEGGAARMWTDDQRPRFTPLTRLDASHVAYDPGACAGHEASWGSVTTVQEAIETLCRLEADNDVVTHNKYLHGSGVVCGLKVVCGPDRTEVEVRPGYALDCEGHAMHLRSSVIYPLVSEAQARQLLDANGDGEVCIRIERDVTRGVRFSLDRHVKRDFWEEVLDGTLLNDFFEHCIQRLVDLVKHAFLPIPDDTVPVSHKQRRLLSVLNLYYQLLNPATGQYVFLTADRDGDTPSEDLQGAGEHDFLLELWLMLREVLEGETFCGIFDGDRPFPDYPYTLPTGIDTAFGLLEFHSRLRLHPDGAFAWTCRGGNTIQRWDLATQEMVELLTFPGGDNLEVQDVAISPDGTRLYAVATQDDTNSIFATATLTPGQPVVWGATSVVCNILFVTLGVHAKHAASLFAIARARGLYQLNPDNIAVEPTTPLAQFGATGMLHFDADGDHASAAEDLNNPNPSPDFSHVARVRLADMAVVDHYRCNGNDYENDMIAVGTTLHVSGGVGGARAIRTFDMVAGVETGAAIPLPEDTIVRLAVVGGTQAPTLLVSLAEGCRVIMIDPATRTWEDTRRIPVQALPAGIATHDGTEVVVLNGLSCTLSIVDVAQVITAAAPPVFTTEPPTTLAAYRQEILDAYDDLLQHVLQYVKDCFCDHFIVDCPDCDDDEVFLGCVDVRGNRVYHICNLEKRHYSKTFRNYSYWLSAVPVLPLLKHLLEELCCHIFETPGRRQPAPIP